MYAMFYGASSFNSDVSSWDVSHVVRMAWMFSYASVSTAMSDDLDLLITKTECVLLSVGITSSRFT